MQPTSTLTDSTDSTKDVGNAGANPAAGPVSDLSAGPGPNPLAITAAESKTPAADPLSLNLVDASAKEAEKAEETTVQMPAPSPAQKLEDPISPLAVNPEPIEVAQPVATPAAPTVQSAQMIEIKNKIEQVTNILVTVRSSPSVDELAAALALTMELDNSGKHATAVFGGKIPDVMTFLKPEKTFENNVHSLRDFIISLNKDKADKLRFAKDGDIVKIYITPYKSTISVDDLAYGEGDFNVEMVIAIGVYSKDELDKVIGAHGRILHDATVTTITPGAKISQLGSINWADPTSSTASTMVMQLMQAMKPGQVLRAEVATALLTGLMEATDRFSNQKTTPEVMKASAELMTSGADHKLVTENVRSSIEGAIKSTNPVEMKTVPKAPVGVGGQNTEAKTNELNSPPKSPAVQNDQTAQDPLAPAGNVSKISDTPSSSPPAQPSQSDITQTPIMDEKSTPPVELDTSEQAANSASEITPGQSVEVGGATPNTPAEDDVVGAPVRDIFAQAQVADPVNNNMVNEDKAPAQNQQFQNPVSTAESQALSSVAVPATNTGVNMTEQDILADIENIYSKEPFDPANNPRQDLGSEVVIPDSATDSAEAISQQADSGSMPVAPQAMQSGGNLTLDGQVPASNADQSNMPNIPGFSPPPVIALPPPPPPPNSNTPPAFNASQGISYDPTKPAPQVQESEAGLIPGTGNIAANSLGQPGQLPQDNLGS